MKRTGFKPKVYERPPRQPLRATADFRYGHIAALLRPPVEKEQALQHEGYMRLVRGLPCILCKVSGFTQFCHADEGKGAGLKTDCRRGWPGCGPHDGLPGCHWFVGTSGRLGKQARRDFESAAGADTREAILALGLWPATLPLWREE